MSGPEYRYRAFLYSSLPNPFLCFLLLVQLGCAEGGLPDGCPRTRPKGPARITPGPEKPIRVPPDP